jgi:hypothetical protein
MNTKTEAPKEQLTCCHVAGDDGVACGKPANIELVHGQYPDQGSHACYAHLHGLWGDGETAWRMCDGVEIKERSSEEIFYMLYASEINFALSTFWDADLDWKLGDHMNGFTHEGCVESGPLMMQQAAAQLADVAMEQYPQSMFKAWYTGFVDPICASCGGRWDKHTAMSGGDALCPDQVAAAESASKAQSNG